VERVLHIDTETDHVDQHFNNNNDNKTQFIRYSNMARVTNNAIHTQLEFLPTFLVTQTALPD